MKPKMNTCNLIMRQLAVGKGITETTLPVASLEELFTTCMTKTEPQLVERLLITGHDAQGRARLITFTFQSVADNDNPPASSDKQPASA